MALIPHTSSNTAKEGLRERIASLHKFKKDDPVIVGGGMLAKVAYLNYKEGKVGVLIGTRIMCVLPGSIEKPEKKG